MDFSKAFDRVRPSLSADPLEANGWPTRLTKLIVCLVEAREVCHIRWAVACQLWLLGASEWLRQDQRRRKDENNSSAAAAGQQLNRHNATERYQHGRGEHGRPHSDQELRNRPVADLSDWKQWSERTRPQENWAKRRTDAQKLRFVTLVSSKDLRNGNRSL